MRRFAAYLFAPLLIAAAFSLADEPTTAPATTAPATTEAAAMPSTLPTTQSASATSQPTTMASVPTTAPVYRPNGLPLSFAVLNERSIFMKGHVSPPGTSTSTTAPPSPTTSGSHVEGSIVFDGVTVNDGSYTAMFEDTTAGKILECKVGDALAQGKLTQITLDSITYESAGRSTRVLVGQTLEAGEAPLLTSRATIMVDSSGNPTTAPSNAGSSGDVLERLRAKRRQELGK